MKCPRCNSELKPVVYDGETAEVCGHCQGEWLSSEQLGKIVEHHDEVFTAQEIASLPGVDHEELTAEKDDHDELKCPECAAQMEHFNYADTSALIIHKCVACDGIWMDKDELRKAEILVDGWKAALQADTEKYGLVLEKVKQKEEAEMGRNVSISRFGIINHFLRRFCE